MRRGIGVGLLALSVLDSLLWLSGWFHPVALRWRAAGGIERTIAIVLASLTFKAALLIVAILLAFWPTRHPKR